MARVDFSLDGKCIGTRRVLYPNEYNVELCMLVFLEMFLMLTFSRVGAIDKAKDKRELLFAERHKSGIFCFACIALLFLNNDPESLNSERDQEMSNMSNVGTIKISVHGTRYQEVSPIFCLGLFRHVAVRRS
jgi:hypothetical protein